MKTGNRKEKTCSNFQINSVLKSTTPSDSPVRTKTCPTSNVYGMQLTSTPVAFTGRDNVVQRDLRIICDLAGVTYLSPHKLRHGHVVHALKQARNMTDLKAISQNVMHSSVTITDGIYGNLVTNDVRDTIAHLGQERSEAGDGLQERLTELLELLKLKR